MKRKIFTKAVILVWKDHYVMYFQVQIKNVLQSLEIDANHAFFIATYITMIEGLKQKLNYFQVISMNW